MRIESLTRGSGYLLRVDSGELDSLRFLELYDAARERLAADDTAAARDRLTDALALWRGDPLADLPYGSVPEADRRRLSELRLSALELRIETGLELASNGELVSELEALVREHPFRERFHGQLMLALYRNGRQAEALEAYRTARRILDDELGVETGPSSESSSGRFSATIPSLSRRAEIKPRGCASAASADVVDRAPARGRSAEFAVRPARLRLVTLTGAGGVGKTGSRSKSPRRSESVRRWSPFVGLASTRDPAHVGSTIGAALEIAEKQAQTMSEALIADLRDRELLLVLDNFERLLDAAPLVAELVDASPRLRVLVTSRNRLRLDAEHEYIVPPLEVPESGDDDLEALARNDSVSIFVARAKAVDRDFELARRMPATSPRSAAGSKACHSRSNSLPPGSSCSRRPRSSTASPGRSSCSPAGHAISPRASRRFEPRSTGASNCSTTTSAGCSRSSRCSQAGPPSRRLSRFAESSPAAGGPARQQPAAPRAASGDRAPFPHARDRPRIRRPTPPARGSPSTSHAPRQLLHGVR